MRTDATHDPKRKSWIETANGHPDFPIQNLPLGIFAPRGEAARAGLAIGDMILDLPAALADGHFSGEAARAVESMNGGALNDFFALGSGPRMALRTQASALLSADCAAATQLSKHLYTAADCDMRLPCRIGSYTDFYVGINHAENVGRQFRPENPLLPNYKHIPIGYHGRASSIRPSGVPFRRPRGQIREPGAEAPIFAPTRRLDLELELGAWIGVGNHLGDTIAIADAPNHVAGFCLLNDWSARDIQAWEYQPLGPFLSKNFASTISPWVVTPEALAPYRLAAFARAAGDPQPLPYLVDATDQTSGGLDISLDVAILTDRMRQAQLAAFSLSHSNARHMYWTISQMVAHHTSGGCNLEAGDLLGTGTISAPERGGYGSLLEMTEGGKLPIQLPNGETRTFLEDGDEIILTAQARKDGFVSIGFGECRARVLAAA